METVDLTKYRIGILNLLGNQFYNLDKELRNAGAEILINTNVVINSNRICYVVTYGYLK